jgi:hypothetical protein
MIDHVRERLTKIEWSLTHSVLDHDKYMMTIGEAQSLQVLVENLQSIYRKNFET